MNTVGVSGAVRCGGLVVRRVEARLEELDGGHGRIVAPAEAVAQHARVAAVAIAVSLGRLLEESVHERLVVDVAERLPPRVQRPICKVNRGVNRGGVRGRGVRLQCQQGGGVRGEDRVWLSLRSPSRVRYSRGWVPCCSRS